MLDKLSSSYHFFGMQLPATDTDIERCRRHFSMLPSEYEELVREGTEIELEHRNGRYLRIWGPLGCIEMDEAYEITQRMPNTFPIGDCGGCDLIFEANGNRGPGIYYATYGDLDLREAVWIAPSLRSVIEQGTGIEKL